MRLAAALAVMLCLSCGGRDGASPGGDAATPGDGGGGATDGGGADVDAGPDPTPAGVLRTSYVSADSYSAGGIESSSVTAGFYDQDPAPLSSSTTTVGPCEVRSTEFLMPGGGGFPSYRDGGTITVAGGSQTATLAQGPGGYMAFTSDSALWAGGETLSLSTPGGVDLPGFDGMLGAPSHVEVTSPLYPLGTPWPVTRTSDVSFTWTGDSAGEVIVRFSGPQELPAPQIDVTCRFAPSDGGGTVPAAALMQIEPTGTGTMSIDVVSEMGVSLPDWGRVRISARSAALRPVRQYGTSVEYR